jgi:hypothetical protein
LPETSTHHREASSVLSSSEEEGDKGKGKAKKDDKADSEKDSDNDVPLDSYQDAENAEAVFKQLKESLVIAEKTKPKFEPLPPIPENQAGPSGHHQTPDPSPPLTPPSSPDEEVMAAAAADARWKFPEPPTFNGEAGAATANSWMLLLEQYFVAPGVPQIMTDRTKINFAFFKMGRRAAPWWDTELRKYTAPAVGNLSAGTFPTWENFKALFIPFLLVFCPPILNVLSS